MNPVAFTPDQFVAMTVHAERRMKERDINKSWVENALQHPQAIRPILTCDHKFEYVGILATATVTFDSKDPLVTTVYRGTVNNPRMKGKRSR